MTKRAQLALAVGALLMLIVAVYSPVLRHGVFLWDDHALIETNPVVARSSLRDILRRPFFPRAAALDAAPAYYRPLAVLTLRADFTLAAYDASSYHLSNVFFHLGAVLAFLGVARRLGASGWASVVAVAAWALHPRTTEAVAWVSGRTDLLATLFGLVGVGAWPWFVRGEPASRPHRRAAWRPAVLAAGSLLALFLALLAKETAMAAVLCVAAGTWLAAPRKAPFERARYALPRIGLLSLAVAPYLALRISALRGLVSTLTPLGAQQRALLVLEAVGRYVEMTLDAWHPATSIGLVGEPDRARAAVGGLALLLSATVAVRSRVVRGSSHVPHADVEAAQQVAVWVPTTLAFAAIALVVHVVPIALAAGVTSDRLLYLPLAGVALGCALAAGRLAPRLRRLAGGATLLATGTFAIVSYGRVGDYTDELRFRVVSAEQATNPRNTSARSGLAAVVRSYGAPDLACRIHRSVVHILEASGRKGTTRHVHALENLGSCYEAIGAYDLAAELYEQLLAARPAVARLHLRLGYVWLHRFELDSAQRELDEALTLDPNLELARQVLAELPSIRARRDRFADPRRRIVDPVGWAQLLESVGRLPDASEAWLPIVEDARSSNDSAWSAYQFILTNGDYAMALRASDAHARRTAIDVPLGKQLLAQRRGKQESLVALRPRIEALIERE